MNEQLQRAYDALQQADAAGNAEDAQKLADFIRELEAQVMVQEEKKAAPADDSGLQNPMTYGLAGAAAGRLLGPAVGAGIDTAARSMMNRKPPAPGAAPAAPAAATRMEPSITPSQPARLSEPPSLLGPGAIKVISHNEQQVIGHPAAMSLARKPEPGFEVRPGRLIATPEGADLSVEAPSPQPQAPLTRSAAQLSAPPAATPPATPPKPSLFNRMSRTLAEPKKVPLYVGGAMAAGQGRDAYEQMREGNVGEAALSGAGALGGLGMFSRIKPVRAAGTLLGVGTPLARMYRGLTKEEDEPERKAMGGLAGYAKGKMVKDLAVGKAPKALNDIFDVGLNLAKKFGYDPKKIAADYPDVISPVLTTDKKTGKEFLQKQLSKEAIAVQNARKAAQAEIDAGKMMNPYFDITKREYVDPSNYPLKGRTLTDVVPKKAETISKYEKLASDPGAQDRLMEAYNLGKDKPLAKDWYAMKQLEDKFIEELGPEAGRKAFRSRFAEPMAATTGGADPNSNLMMVAYTNMMREKGLPIPANAFDLPFPIGGRYVSGNMDQARKYHEMGSIPIDNPKRHNFASNFMGYRDRPTIDEQMMGLFAPGKGAPEPGTYGVYESQLNKLAKEAGVNPVNFQDVAWAGAKKYSGKPMMQEINEMLYRTGRITGEDPETILKGYIRGNKPMYGLTGLGGLQALDNENEEGGPAEMAEGGKTPTPDQDLLSSFEFERRKEGRPSNYNRGTLSRGNSRADIDIASDNGGNVYQNYYRYSDPEAAQRDYENLLAESEMRNDLSGYAEGGKTAAWQRAEGKNPEGGLNAKGRASYKAETGGTLKRPQPEGGARRDSFCARMTGMKKKLTSSKTANDPDSRINKALRKWKC